MIIIMLIINIISSLNHCVRTVYSTPYCLLRIVVTVGFGLSYEFTVCMVTHFHFFHMFNLWFAFSLYIGMHCWIDNYRISFYGGKRAAC